MQLDEGVLCLLVVLGPSLDDGYSNIAGKGVFNQRVEISGDDGATTTEKAPGKPMICIRLTTPETLQ
jgi:hypothetical protein